MDSSAAATCDARRHPPRPGHDQHALLRRQPARPARTRDGGDYRRIDEDGRRYRISDLRGPGGAEKGNPYYEVMGVWRYWAYSKQRMDKMIAEGRVIQTRPGAVLQYKRYLDEMPGVSVQVETIARQGAAVGILLMAALPTREMEARAAAAGRYDLGVHGRYPRIQIITLAEFFSQGKRPRLPNIDRTSAKAAKRENISQQGSLL